MNSDSIRRLRKKFIVISTLTYCLVMLFMGGLINLSNVYVTRRQIRRVLDYMLETEIEGGEYYEGADSEPAFGETEDSAADAADSAEAITGSTAAGAENLSGSAESTSGIAESTSGIAESTSGIAESTAIDVPEDALNSFSPEFSYSVRYFMAVFDKNGEMLRLDTAHTRAISAETAENYAARAYRSRHSFGHIGQYYYEKGTDGEGHTHVIYLNCSTQIESNRRIMYITLIILGAGAVITFILVYLFSYRVIQPEIENVRRQKQFITNASHELKTPLAVIRANTEIEEMMNGENEWTQSTMRQVDRLSGLIQNLVMISRAQEKEDRSAMTSIDVTKAVSETVDPYRSLAQQEKKELTCDFQPDIHMVADESKIRQLTSLLVDNAFKYCDENGSVKAVLDSQKKGKIVRFAISNSYEAGENVDYSKFFERFYREDQSHNVDKGGYGIGLSIAESICHQYGGSISASWKDGEITFTCLLPV